MLWVGFVCVFLYQTSLGLELKTNAISGWATIGDSRKYYRSKAEYRYACYLQWLKQQGAIVSWSHEPKTFWFEGIRRGTVSYKPDFLVVERNSHHWVEVKGYMDARSKTKINRFKRYFPEEQLIVIDSKWYKRNSGKLKNLIPGW